MTYRRCIYHSDEWKELTANGWITLAVNVDRIALIAKRDE
jgi:hypothetical protein